MNPESLHALTGVLAVLIGGAAILTPIVALAARFAFKPVVESWIQLRKEAATDQDKVLQDRRIALLEAEFHNLEAILEQRLEVAAFDRELAGSRDVVPEAGRLPASRDGSAEDGG